MQININPSWKEFLKPEFEQSYFVSLMKSVEEEYANNHCFPPKELIFNAFNQFEANDLKVVIIGQDPYHGTGEANGLCFSVNDGIKIPPSLRNIFSEINLQYDRLFIPTTGNLAPWAKQGVLLLNATMTVRKDIPNSHKKLGWQSFTDSVIQKISDGKEQIVFLLWGSFAHKKAPLIDSKKHLVLQCGHPSFANVHKKWYGNNHFIVANDYLKDTGKKPIEW
ncbi:uracil-DNA glycosylase [Flavobacterium sp.]